MKLKKASTRVVVHKVDKYRGFPFYIRQIGKEYFEYIIIIDDEVWSSYIIM